MTPPEPGIHEADEGTPPEPRQRYPSPPGTEQQRAYPSPPVTSPARPDEPAPAARRPATVLVRLRAPRSVVVMLLLVLFLFVDHSVGPVLAVPAGGPFPSGSFQIQSTVDGTCVGLAPGSASGDPYRIGPVAMVVCRAVPEQTWRYDRAKRHLMVVSTLAGPCAEQGVDSIEVANCATPFLGGLRVGAQQWALTADGAITGGDLSGWGEVVTGIPRRGCWEANGEEIWVTACRDAAAQRWQAVPVSP